MGSDTLEDLLSQDLQVLVRVVRQEEGEVERSQLDEGICRRIRVEDLVEFVDFRLEAGVDGDEWEQLRVFVAVAGQNRVEYDWCRHISYIITR